MHYNWITHKSAIEKIKQTGLAERISAQLKREYLGKIDYEFENEEYLWTLEDLKERGFLKEENFDFKKCFLEQVYSPNEKFNKVRKMILNPYDFYWKIQKETEHVEMVELEFDLANLSGLFASKILTPAEFWDPKKFGFESTFDLIGSLGAHMQTKSREYMQRGYKWESKIGEKTFSTEVTGSEHGDFRLFRTDITDYRTTDPLGNIVSYRPQLREEINCVAAYHSVEPELLETILKYIEQEKIDSEIIKNRREFIQEMKSSPSYLGNFADAGMGGIMGTRGVFSKHEFDIPPITQYNTKQYHPRILMTETRDNYSFSIGKNKELAFHYQAKNENAERNPTILIPPQEIDQLIRGLFMQAKNGLGRTSLNQLCETLEFPLTEQYKMDLEESRRFLRN